MKSRAKQAPLCSAEWFDGTVHPPDDGTHFRVIAVFEDCTCDLVWWARGRWRFVGTRRGLPAVKCWTRLPWLNEDHPFSLSADAEQTA